MDEKSIPLDMFLELVFSTIYAADTMFTMRPLYDVANDILRFIRNNVSSQTFRYFIEHGLTAEYCEIWLRQRHDAQVTG